MKIKLQSFLILFVGLLILSGKTYALGVPITGTSFGDKIGLIHFDYKTAEEPVGNTNFDNTDSKYYVGPTKQFYVSPQDEIFDGLDPLTTFVPGDKTVTAHISVEEEDCTIDGCLLTGFLWSDKIGWIVIDGKQINTAVSTASGFTGQENGSGDPYPSYMYPRIKMVPIAPNNRVSITGYGWNEYTGWLRFSSDDAGTIGVVTDVNTQELEDWGTWLEINEDMQKILVDEGAEDESEILLGRNLHGYAWSEKLGWIKFSAEATDTFDFNFGALTVWVPDKKPPVFLGPDKVWFATGVNTGDHDNATTIVWDQFAADDESGINSETTEVYVKFDENFIDHCGAFIPAKESIGRNTYPFPSNYPVSAEVLDKLNGSILSLSLPLLGMVENIPSGFCKYEIHAKIVDLVKNTIYIGDHFINPAINDDIDPADPPSPTANPITVFVRAGNYSAENSEVKFPAGESESAIADGKEAIKYRVDLKDIAGNPIVDINCNDYPDEPYYQYDECPERRVSITATLENDLVYDLIQGTPSMPYLTPVRHSEASVETTGNDLLAKVHGSIVTDSEGVETTTINPEYLWDGTEANNANKNKWEIPVHRLGLEDHYPLEIASFAPNISYLASDKTTPSRSLEIKSFNYFISNDELPATSKIITEVEPLTLSDDSRTIIEACNEPSNGSPSDIVCVNPNNETDPDNGYDPGALNMFNAKCSTGIATAPHSSCLTFIPPIFTDNPNLIAGGISNVLSLSVPANLTFDINNISSKEIDTTHSVAGSRGGLSIDNVFQYYSDNPSVALMELHRITTPSESGQDGNLAWTDPFEPCDYCTRFELFDGSHSSLIGDISANNSPFHGVYQAFHSGFKFSYDFGIESTSGIQTDGTYTITGRESIPQIYKADPETGEYPNGQIDRSDPANLKIGSGSIGSAAKVLNKELQFTPEKFIPVTINDIKFQVVQEIAYRFADQDLFTIYASEEPLITDIDVKDIGLEAIGTVAGDQIVTDRQFDVVSTDSTRDLQEQIRRNVAEMTASITPCPVKELTSDETDIYGFELSGDCTTTDNVNGTMIAFYEGTSDEELVLGDGVSDLVAPNMPYTIIVQGGANVFIKSNIIYNDDNASLGIIVIAENIGDGANTYISPVPTNIATTLYTEGSVISRPEGSVLANATAVPKINDPSLVYYGGSAGNVQDLGSQLYWQGSIASRNTIGGAGQEKVPEGIDCLDGDGRLNCAQRYDFDYLRRFTAVNEEAREDPEDDNSDLIIVASKIANNGKFSGGGSCDNETGLCIQGPIAKTPPLIKLDASGFIIEDPTISQLAPFFVEKDPRALNNPPPGFTLSGGLDSTQVIR